MIYEECIQFLKEHHIPYELISHEETNTMEACLAFDEKNSMYTFKNLLLTTANKKNLCYIMMKRDQRFQTSVISKKLQMSRMSFVSTDSLYKYMSVTPGSLSILGMLFYYENLPLRIVIDPEILQFPYLGIHPCDSRYTLKISKENFLILLNLLVDSYEEVNFDEDSHSCTF